LRSVVRGAEEFASVLGTPLRPGDVTELEALGTLWGVTLPHDFLEIASAYGDSTISGYLTFNGPRTLGFKGELFGPGLPDWNVLYDRDGIAVLPTPGGMLLRGSTIEGDMLCLKRRESGRWTVSASLRDWFEWRDYDLEFSDWFYLALLGRIGEDWLPEWGPLPHPLAEFGPNPFGVESMGSGPGGSSV
jgi:hypothetical protein